jgi:cytochrome P450
MAESTLAMFPFENMTGLDTPAEYPRMRREDPLPMVKLAAGGQAYLATRYEDVKRVFGDGVFSREATRRPESAVLSLGSRVPYSLLNMDPPEHLRIRRLIASTFTTRAAERLRPRIQQIADELVEAMLAQGPPAEFVAAFAAPLPALLASELLGVPNADRDQLRAWLDGFAPSDSVTPETLAATIEAVTAYLSRLVASRRTAPADDVVSALVAAQEQGADISEPEILHTILLLIAGGYETTAALLTNSIVILQRYPDQLALLRDKPELVPDAVEELLRYVPIVWSALERVALEDVELSGVRVPAGASVIPVTYAANRDPALAGDAERLDVTRPQLPHLSFGYGVHHCVGAPLARVELQVAFTTLLRRLPQLRPAEPEATLTWKTGLLVVGPSALPVVW